MIFSWEMTLSYEENFLNSVIEYFEQKIDDCEVFLFCKQDKYECLQ